jgi:nitrilase
MLRMAMYNKGIQLYCAPTADDRDTWIPTMQHVAMEGRCFVLSCNQRTTRGDFPKDYAAIQGDDPAAVISRGGSCIVNPLGKILAGPNFESEAILTADLDMGDIARGKYDFDVTGHYSRPDIFRLIVNESATPAVVAHANDVEMPPDPFDDGQ